MTRRGRWFLAVRAVAGIGLAALGGCSRAFVVPIAAPPHRDQAAAPYDVTWKALIRAFAMENVPLRVVARDSGVIASDDFVSPIGVYADCGRLGDVVLEGEALVAFTVFVQSNRNSGTDIQVNARHAGVPGFVGQLAFRAGYPRVHRTLGQSADTAPAGEGRGCAASELVKRRASRWSATSRPGSRA
jgi:hypothetical protein